MSDVSAGRKKSRSGAFLPGLIDDMRVYDRIMKPLGNGQLKKK